jgi:hypothetical protein
VRKKILLGGIIFVAFWGLTISVCLAEKEKGVRTESHDASGSVLQRHRVESLKLIPDTAELILIAPWASTRTSGGFRINELYVMDAEGEHITRITHNGHLYNQRVEQIRWLYRPGDRQRGRHPLSPREKGKMGYARTLDTAGEIQMMK